MDCFEDLFDDDDVIYTYNDEQAIADGILVALDNIIADEYLPHTPSCLKINRVTAAVFEAFAVREPELYTININAGCIEPAYDPGPVIAAIREVLEKGYEENGWYIGSYKGRDLWIVPNEIGGATLMFPEDY